MLRSIGWLNSPGNPGNQSRRRKGRLGWKGFVEKEGFRNERVRGDG